MLWGFTEKTDFYVGGGGGGGGGVNPIQSNFGATKDNPIQSNFGATKDTG